MSVYILLIHSSWKSDVKVIVNDTLERELVSKENLLSQDDFLFLIHTGNRIVHHHHHHHHHGMLVAWILTTFSLHSLWISITTGNAFKLASCVFTCLEWATDACVFMFWCSQRDVTDKLILTSTGVTHKSCSLQNER